MANQFEKFLKLRPTHPKRPEVMADHENGARQVNLESLTYSEEPTAFATASRSGCL